MGTLIDNIQYVTNNKGEKTALMVPIEKWDELLDLIVQRHRFSEELKEAFEEVKLIRAGKIKARPVQELLNEL
jgi:hypothetical protein